MNRYDHNEELKRFEIEASFTWRITSIIQISIIENNFL